MEFKLFQCCYTNASKETDGTVTSGWQPLCVSRDIPSAALAECTRLQNNNSAITNTMLDEDGNTLNLLEFSGDGSYIYVIRTQYGLMDRLGRANMFSHAFIVPAQPDVIAEPNAYVTIANSNFRYSEEEAADTSREIVFAEGFTPQSAMEQAGLTESTLKTLIRCVYCQYSEKRISEPLYIRYDGDEEKLRAILFCIYYGLPFSVRRQLSAASCMTENTKRKNLIFSKNAGSRGLYVDPVTGDNNILSSRVDMRLSRLGFLDDALDRIYTGTAKYYAALEKEATLLGDSAGKNETILRIAALILKEENLDELDEAELEKRLNEALSSDSVGNREMDNYIALLLNAFMLRGKFLPEPDEGFLEDRMKQTDSEKLKESVRKYYFACFRALPAEEAVEKLKNLSEEGFREYRKGLLQDQDGQDLLDQYYASVVEETSCMGFRDLEEMFRETRDLNSSMAVDHAVGRKAVQLYNQAVSLIAQGKYADIKAVYEGYCAMMALLYGEAEAARLAEDAKRSFWDMIRYPFVNAELEEQYEQMRVNGIRRSDIINEIFFISNECRDSVRNTVDRFMRKASWFADSCKAVSSGKAEHDEIKACFLRIADQVFGSNSPDAISWGSVTVDIPPRFVSKVAVLWEDVRQRSCPAILRDIKAYLRTCRDERLGDAPTARLCDLLLKYCVKFEEEGMAVPLDLWLTLSLYSRDNPFRIFDQVKPKVLYLESEQVLANSRCLQYDLFRQKAEVYIQNRGQEAKTVKKWLYETQDKKGLLNKVSILRKK